MQETTLGEAVAKWPVEQAAEPAPRFQELAIRACFQELLTDLTMGQWKAQEAEDLHACLQAMRDFDIGAARGNIFSATSDDGLNFTRENKLIVSHGSAFQALGLPDGRIGILSVCYDADTLIARRGAAGRLDLSYSEDGLNFTRDMSFRIVGLFTQHAIDPDIVLLPDGSLRIYYLARVDAKDIKGRIFSARSTDSHVFWQEEGIRYDNPYRGIDHKAIQIDGERWKLFNHVNNPARRQGGARWTTGSYEAERLLGHNTIVGATSVDGGMTFTVDDEFPGLTGAVVSVKRFPDGFRMYYSTHAREDPTENRVIRSAFSTDGDHWQEEEGVRLDSGGSPTVVETGGGKYRMYYGMRSTEPA